MITRETVFILGAGASHPYGFPLGSKLIEEICQVLTPTFDPSPVYVSKHGVAIGPNRFETDTEFKEVVDTGFSEDFIQKFVSDLKGSKLKSIDSFLQYKNAETRSLGKMAIIQALSQYKITRGDQYNDDWFAELWNVLHCDPNEFKNHKLSFVTFNYDTSLEHNFYNVLSSTHGFTPEDCYETMKNIPIIHVYGTIGEIPWIKRSRKPTLIEASDAIYTIHELNTDRNLSTRKSIDKLIADARRIYFLGFGYHEANLQILRANEWNRLGRPKLIMGNAYNLPDKKRVEVNKFSNGSIRLTKETLPDIKDSQFINEIVELE